MIFFFSNIVLVYFKASNLQISLQAFLTLTSISMSLSSLHSNKCLYCHQVAIRSTAAFHRQNSFLTLSVFILSVDNSYIHQNIYKKKYGFVKSHYDVNQSHLSWGRYVLMASVFLFLFLPSWTHYRLSLSLSGWRFSPLLLDSYKKKTQNTPHIFSLTIWPFKFCLKNREEFFSQETQTRNPENASKHWKLSTNANVANQKEARRRDKQWWSVIGLGGTRLISDWSQTQNWQELHPKCESSKLAF